jgi:23S rRNA pseudouridine1911/1915/1917 synthase
VTPGRLDAVLAAAFADLSRARVQRLIAEGHVTRNSAPVRKSEQVEAGDLLELTIPETPHEAAGVSFDLPILYEDAWVVAVDKPAGIPVHGAPGERRETIADWFLARYPAEATAFDVEHPGVVHRLDRDTTGVLLLAKTPGAQAALSAAFEARSAMKTYLAVCDGVPRRPQAIIDAPIARDPADRTRMAIVRRGGRAARTGYRLLGDDGRQSLLLVDLFTGRTHQARVHLAAVGLPVSGDTIYGEAPPTAGRQLLHAWRIAVPHPGGGMVTVTAPMPADMAAAVRAMGLDGLASEYSEPHAAARTPPPEATTA